MVNDVNYDYTLEIKNVEKKDFDMLSKDNKRIINTIICKSKEINSYEEFLEILKLDNSESRYKNIKNFLRYRILTKLEIVDNFDCDNLLPVKEILKKYIKKRCEYVNIKYDMKERYFNIDDWIFETDTANSFQTLFGQYMRTMYKDKYKEYINVYNVKENEILRDFYLLNNIDVFFNYEEKVLDKFNEFASCYHKIGNFVLVPFGYNKLRNIMYKDYYDLSIASLRDKYWNCFYNKKYDNLFKVLTGEDFILKFYPGEIKSKNDKQNIVNSIDNMITFINKRGKEIINTIEGDVC